MYQYVDWMKCKGCGDTGTLFFCYVDRRTGIPTVKVTGKCRVCYLDANNMKFHSWYLKNKDKLLAKQKENRVLFKEEYNRRARGYRRKHRFQRIEQQREKRRQIKLLNEQKIHDYPIVTNSIQRDRIRYRVF